MPKLPRDISGTELARLLRLYGYEITRQKGSHIRLTGNKMGIEHHVTIPAHAALKIGTLNAIITDIAHYLKMEKQDVITALFR